MQDAAGSSLQFAAGFELMILVDIGMILVGEGRMELNTGGGEVKICSSYDATQLLFNQDCLEFTDFRERVVDANGNAPFLLWDRESLELFGGITTEKLKAMQPKVPTKIPKEIESLVGRGMLFKINVQRDRLEKRNLAFPVMQIKEDIAVLNQYCHGLLNDTK
nr:replication factor A protein 1-like [Ipomoea batatas]